MASRILDAFTEMDRNQSYRADVVVFASVLCDASYLHHQGVESYKGHLNNTAYLLKDILGRVRIEIMHAFKTVVYSTSNNRMLRPSLAIAPR